MRRIVTITVAALVGIGLAGCGSDGSGSGAGGGAASSTAASPSISGDITVLAAASLTESFTTLGQQFEAAHPGVKVTFSFAAQLGAGHPDHLGCPRRRLRLGEHQEHGAGRGRRRR